MITTIAADGTDVRALDSGQGPVILVVPPGMDDVGYRGPDPAGGGAAVGGRLAVPPRRQRRSVSPSPTPRVEAAWTASEDRGAPDRLVAFLTGGDGDTRTGRLCPRCGSSRHGRPFLRRTDVPAAERISIARTTGGRPGGARARTHPAVICGRVPNLTGVTYLVSASSAPKTSAAVVSLAVQPM